MPASSVFSDAELAAAVQVMRRYFTGNLKEVPPNIHRAAGTLCYFALEKITPPDAGPEVTELMDETARILRSWGHGAANP